MIKLSGLSLVLILTYYSTAAQDWTLISQQKLDDPVEICNTDRFGNIYLSDRKGNFRKLDQSGLQVAQFASQHYGKLTTLETWTSLRMFLFYQDIQQYVFLDRYLNQSEFMDFPQGLFGLVNLASPSSDNQLWLFDAGPLNLTKFDINFGTITLSQSLNQFAGGANLQPYHLFEYQNRVYLGDSKLGILVFDNLGNYIHTVDKTGTERFYPYQEELYFLRRNQLHFVSLYNQSQRHLELPETQMQYLHALMTESSLILITSSQLLVYNYTPR